MKYELSYSKFTKRWLVVHAETRVAHSAWKSVIDARAMLYDLTKRFQPKAKQ